MNRELVINSTPKGVEIALLEDKRLVELHREVENSKFNVGDIYLGRVRKLNPGLNAAFVDVGYDRDAFLHYTDLGPQFKSLFRFTQRAVKGSQQASLKNFKTEPDIIKTGKINQVLSKNQNILIQILKEPISTKGPRIGSEIALPGRYLVLTPFNGSVGVSRRITTAKERSRLQRLIESIAPSNFGIIVRTAAENQTASVLHEDLSNLLDQWTDITKKLKSARAPHIIFSESKRTNILLRDLLNASFNKMYVNDPVIHHEIRSYVKKIAPGKEKILQLHSSSKPIFDARGITKQIKSLFGKTVSLDSGAYLVIEHTEAMHVIDINSGPKVSTKGDQEHNAFNVNIETAKEVARQLRLRDIGGIIIIDFIDMRNSENRKLIYKEMKEAMKEDRAKHTILPVSRFGLMQITRQRVRPEINIITTENCPACRGTGKVEATILLIDEIEKKLNHVLNVNNQSGLKLLTHPFIAAYLKKGIFSSQLKWLRDFHKWVKIEADNTCHILEYHFLDANGEEIKG